MTTVKKLPQRTADRISQLLARRKILVSDLVSLVEVGSTAHGIGTGSDDLDFTAVRLESWHEFVNGPEDRASLQIRTAIGATRSGFDDIDLNVYTLRKFCRLAAKGNPSILAVMFSEDYYAHRLPDLEYVNGFVASRKAGYAFMGYMNQQLERWQGKRGQKNVTRPELVEAYGFDTKYAGHIIRLGIQGRQYLDTGRFSVPMDPTDAEMIRDIRTGKWSESAALELGHDLLAVLEAAMETSPLPPQPNVGGLNSWLADQYQMHYGTRWARRNPTAIRHLADLGHRVEDGQTLYQPRCICGWRMTGWRKTEQSAQKKAEEHIAKFEQQRTLEEVE